MLWCICVTSAYAVLVEQPDTLLHHVLDVSLYPDVDVVETTTAALGDTDRKFLRLTMRNFSGLAFSDHNPPPLPRPRQYRYRYGIATQTCAIALAVRGGASQRAVQPLPASTPAATYLHHFTTSTSSPTSQCIGTRPDSLCRRIT